MSGIIEHDGEWSTEDLFQMDHRLSSEHINAIYGFRINNAWKISNRKKWVKRYGKVHI